jgi:RecG-like helicase
VTENERTGVRCWGGRPVATTIADASPRQRVAVTGTVESTRTFALGSGVAYACVLTDGTGEIGLVFLGRHAVPGMVPGARCSVEGTARMVDGSLVVWNPRYRFEAGAPA